jgi:hypothetical protein
MQTKVSYNKIVRSTGVSPSTASLLTTHFPSEVSAIAMLVSLQCRDYAEK